VLQFAAELAAKGIAVPEEDPMAVDEGKKAEENKTLTPGQLLRQQELLENLEEVKRDKAKIQEERKALEARIEDGKRQIKEWEQEWELRTKLVKEKKELHTKIIHDLKTL
jgi:hypothetical protein